MNFVKRIMGLLVIVSLLLGTGGIDVAYAYFVPARVNSLIDELHGDCTQLHCTLRAAIRKANPGDTISFAGNVTGGTIVLLDELVIDKSITINGRLGDGKNVIISGDEDFRAFYVEEYVEVSIKNMYIVDVVARNSYGSAIYNNNGRVHLDNVQVKDGAHSAIYLYSPDPFVASANLVVDNSSFQNVIGGSGGAINGSGFVEVNNTYFEMNHASNKGGAINLSLGNLNISNSTFDRNNANKGGAIFFEGADLMISNSTFFANRAVVYNGGAIFAEQSLNVKIENSTFSNNSTRMDGSAFMVTGWGTLELNNTIIANQNINHLCSIGEWVDFEYTNNLVETTPFDRQCGAPVIWGDPSLGQLQYNGGATPTMLPDAQSYVVDAGDNSTCTAFDQIGTNRPLDGDGDSKADCDIGAIELNPK